MKRTILIILLCVLSNNAYTQTIPSTADIFHKQDFDVLKYQADINFTAFPDIEMNGKVNIILNWIDTNKNKNFYFHLKELEVDSIIYHKKNIAYEIKKDEADVNYYSIEINNDNISNDTITIFYSGEMGNSSWGGVYYHEELMYSIGTTMSDTGVSALRYWLPCYDHPSDKAQFDFTFVVPAGKRLVSNGSLMRTDNPDNGTDVYHWASYNNAATYLINFALGNLETIHIPYKGVPIYIYSLAQDSVMNAYVYKNVPKMLAFQEKIFGKYPFSKLGFINTTIGSMEHQTLISMSKQVIQQAYSKKDTNNVTIFHEMSHQWFGNSISPLDFTEVWLNESFAVYMEALWHEHLYEKKGYISKLKRNMIDYINYQASHDKYCPLYKFDRHIVGNYPYTIYIKGAVVLGMLRHHLGDEIFFSMLKAYVNKYSDSNITTKEYIKFVNTYTKQDLNWFFDQWVKAKGFPKIKIDVDKRTINGQNILNSIKLTQTQNEDFPTFINLPISIKIYGANETHEIIAMMNERELIIDLLDSNFVCSYVEVNNSENFVTMLKIDKIKYTDIKEFETETIVFPNPSDDYIEISNMPFDLNNGILQLFDEMGKIHIEKNNLFISKGKNYSLDINHLMQGNYFIKIISNENIKILKCSIIR